MTAVSEQILHGLSMSYKRDSSLICLNAYLCEGPICNAEHILLANL